MSYYDNEELLNYFTREIKARAQKKIDELKKDIESIKKRQLKQIDDELQNSIFKTMNNKIDDLVAEHNASINKLKIENHKNIIQKRKELLDSVILDVKKKCSKFIKTKDYEKKMIEKVSSMKELFKDNAIVFKINSKDETIKQVIKDNYKGKFNIETDENIQIGGFIAVCNKLKILSDQTLDTRINIKQQWFYEHAKLAVNI